MKTLETTIRGVLLTIEYDDETCEVEKIYAADGDNILPLLCSEDALGEIFDAVMAHDASEAADAAYEAEVEARYREGKMPGDWV
jgi:predicted hydrolase (HD superfamily)